jgi:hypothetical protein
MFGVPGLLSELCMKTDMYPSETVKIPLRRKLVISEVLKEELVEDLLLME